MMIIMTIKILESLCDIISLMSMAVLCGRYYYPLCTVGKLRLKNIQDFAQDHTLRQCQGWDSRSS